MATDKLWGLWFWGCVADNVTADDEVHEFDDGAVTQKKKLFIYWESSFFFVILCIWRTWAVWQVDNAIHWINQYPADKARFVLLTLIHWIVIDQVDNIIRPWNNWRLNYKCSVQEDKYRATVLQCFSVLPNYYGTDHSYPLFSLPECVWCFQKSLFRAHHPREPSDLWKNRVRTREPSWKAHLGIRS